MPRAYAYGRGVVASEVAAASGVGAAVLAAGGNAVDAAVATSLALAVTVPHLGGVGGDFFMLYRDPDGRVHYVAGNGQAPRLLSRDLLLGLGWREVPERGPLSPVVPGMLGGLYEAWRRFGAMEWRDLVEPAARLAQEGFPAPESLARAVEANRECLSRDRGSRVYLAVEGPGSPVRLPGLAALLRGVAEDPWFLYRGEPAEALESYMASVGGLIDTSDLRSYRPEIGEPLRGEAFGATVYETPPPTQGATALHLMYLAEEALEAAGVERPGPAEAALAVLASARDAYLVRDTLIGDPRYMEVSPWELADRSRLPSLIERARTAVGASEAPGGGGDTTFFAVADPEGGIVAGIQSLFYPFGSCVTEPRFTITLNNRARGFTLAGGLPRTLRPGAKPLHTLSAVIAEAGETVRPRPRGARGEGPAVVALGTSGGHYRPQMHAYFAALALAGGLGPLEAINADRILWNPETGALVYEGGMRRLAECLLTGQGCPKGLEGLAARARDSLKPGKAVEAPALGVASSVDYARGYAGGYTDRRGEGVPVPSW